MRVGFTAESADAIFGAMWAEFTHPEIDYSRPIDAKPCPRCGAWSWGYPRRDAYGNETTEHWSPRIAWGHRCALHGAWVCHACDAALGPDRIELIRLGYRRYYAERHPEWAPPRGWSEPIDARDDRAIQALREQLRATPDSGRLLPVPQRQTA